MQASDIVAASSIVIAVLALAVSVYQSALVRQHNRQSVRPVLQLHTRLRPGGKAGLRLVNVGLGPAVITSSVVSVDGRELGEYNEEASNLIRGNVRPRPSAVTFESGAILATDYDEFLLSVDEYDPALAWHASLVSLVREQMRLEIRYTSLYGAESWTVRWRGRRP
jgi:hypothetical protein